MSEGIELQQLEEFVTKLLMKFDALRQANEKLEGELTEKRAMIEELSDQITMQQLEREEVSQRVTSIVSQFENWERELSEEGEVATEEQALVEEIAGEETPVQEANTFNHGSSYNQG